MREFVEQAPGIYRLRVPFGTVYTSVFLVRTGCGAILVDCATTDKDVNEYIVPALSALGVELKDVGGIVITHGHGDHAGGLPRIKELMPHVEVIREARELCDGIFTYPMAGHTEDSIGVLDMRSHILISGDGLQGAGVGKYRCIVKLPEAYINTVEKIRNDDRIESILFSHAYEPWNSDIARGRKRVLECLEDCLTCFEARAENG